MLHFQRIETDGTEGKVMPVKGRVVSLITRMARIVKADDQQREMRLFDDEVGDIARVVSFGGSDIEVRMPLDKFLQTKTKIIRMYGED